MAFKNNVTRLLDSKQIAYTVYTYDYDAGIHSAVEVATAVGKPVEQVFKTLVVVADQPGRKPMLVIIPGAETCSTPAGRHSRQLAAELKIRRARQPRRATERIHLSRWTT